MVFASDWMQKLRFSLVGCWGAFDCELCWWWWGGCKCFKYEINLLGKFNEFMVESFVAKFAII